MTAAMINQIKPRKRLTGRQIEAARFSRTRVESAEVNDRKWPDHSIHLGSSPIPDRDAPNINNAKNAAQPGPPRRKGANCKT